MWAHLKYISLFRTLANSCPDISYYFSKGQIKEYMYVNVMDGWMDIDRYVDTWIWMEI